MPATTQTYTIALAGNGFITSAPPGAHESITDNGLANWTNSRTVTSVFFRISSPGSIALSLTAFLAGMGSSTIRVTVNGTVFTVDLHGPGTTPKSYDIGTVSVSKAGYVQVDLQGVSKTGRLSFGAVSALAVSSTSTIQYANDPTNYYWSRRGPSVHMTYNLPSSVAQQEYFHNEVFVPSGQDPIGSYFMTAGFDGGYAGIQVNSATERRVLFSVWDPTTGTEKTTLVSKGPGVKDNTFGGEGTGGQSYLLFNWTAGTTYKFITRIRPDPAGTGSTLYSAWFYAANGSANNSNKDDQVVDNNGSDAQWRYIATWKRPNTHAYQSGVYSFLENFSDTHGYLGRNVVYSNQWVWARTADNPSNGTWHELTTANFTGDATASNAQRMDYAGGVDSSGKAFFLRNGGFFADYVDTDKDFTRGATGMEPDVNLDQLPVGGSDVAVNVQ